MADSKHNTNDRNEPSLKVYAIAAVTAAIAAGIFVYPGAEWYHSLIAAGIAFLTALHGVFMRELIAEALVVLFILICFVSGIFLLLAIGKRPALIYWFTLIVVPWLLGLSIGKLTVGVWRAITGDS